MFRLIHISDLHLSPLPPPSWRQSMSKRLTGYLNWKFNRKDALEKRTFDALMHDVRQQKPDHIAISGDIVNLSLDAEFARARRRIAELGREKDISLVFGNHDAYIPGAFKKACKAFAPWIIGNGPAGKNCFPYMRIRGQVAIIGTSSAVAMPPFSAAGYFGPRQAEDMAMLLRQAGERGLFRVVMIHHPPLYHAISWNKRLWGIGRFQQAVAACGAELVLHGHTHLPTLSFMPGKDCRQVPVVGVASASQDFGGRRPPADYNLFEIGKDRAGTWQCYLTRRGIADKAGGIGVLVNRKLLL